MIIPKIKKMFLETKELTIDKQDLERTTKSLQMSKLEFVELENKLSPLCALIAFCHTQLSEYCLNIKPLIF